MVTDVAGDDVRCAVAEGGTVSNNKGISLPGMNVSVPTLSDKEDERPVLLGLHRRMHPPEP